MPNEFHRPLDLDRPTYPETFAPQLPQDLDPGTSFVPQAPQYFTAAASPAGGFFTPQPPQTLDPGRSFTPHAVQNFAAVEPPEGEAFAFFFRQRRYSSMKGRTA